MGQVHWLAVGYLTDRTAGVSITQRLASFKSIPRDDGLKFLIVGASGFIGRHLATYTKSLGLEVIGTQSQPRRPDLVTFDLLHDRIADRVNASFFENTEQTYGIICAMTSNIDRCFLERETSYKVDVENTIRLIQDLQSLEVKPVYISSGSVYDGITGYYSEEHPRSPINEYARHKAAVESYIEINAPDMLVLRPDKVVGDDPSENHMFSDWYQCMKENKPIVCMEAQLFSPTWVEDVAQAITLGCKLNLSGIFNLASSEYFTRSELAMQFVANLGGNTEVICKPQSEFGFLEVRPKKSYLDSSRFVKATDMRFTSMREVFRIFKQKACQSI